MSNPLSANVPPEVSTFKRKVETAHRQHTRTPVVLSRREARHVYAYISQLERAVTRAALELAQNP